MEIIRKKLLVLCVLISALVSINELTGQCYSNTGNNWNDSWTSCQLTTNPNNQRGVSHWIQFEFEAPQSIADTWIWNANQTGQSNAGARDVVIDYSTDGTSWTELGTYRFPQANEQPSYTGFQGPDFGGIFVKEILFTILNTYGNSCATLSEVQFNIDPNSCNGTVDICGVCNGAGQTRWYRDANGDGLGNVNDSILACTQPDGFVNIAGDPCDNGLASWDEIGAMFSNNGCLGCHGPAALGGLRLDSYDDFLLGGDICGPSISTGSTLVDVININNYDGCGTAIPFPSMNQRVGGSLNDGEIERIQQWIDMGASENCNCPNNMNVALVGTPSMSSTFFSADASNVNDDIIGTNLFAHTNGDSPHEWIDLDLGSAQNIDDIVIWNRTSCCSERLNNVYVLVADTPFPSNTDLTSSLANADFTFQLGNVSNEATITVNVGEFGRFVRLQKSGNNPGGNFIHILELQVILGGDFSDSDNDGVCDNADSCPGIDDNLIGTSCDDGNACTYNDVWNSSCECVGKEEEDSDRDGICDAVDVMPDNPCTADGVIDGVEPAGFMTDLANDCDGDFITLLEGDLDDFNACINNQGPSTNAECKCPGNEFTAGATVVSNSADVEDPEKANGLPDGESALMAQGNTISYQFPNLDISAEICFFIGFSEAQAAVTIDINYYPYSYVNPSPNLPAYTPQEFCIRTDISGTQMVTISAMTQTISVDGTSFEFCECTDLDPTYDPQNSPCTSGEPCDDGNYCTANDAYDCDCNCIGIPTNITATNAPCIVGNPCDDGDACTVNDVYDCECNCVGEFEGYEVIPGVAIDVGTGGGETFMIGADNIVYQRDECLNQWNNFSSLVTAERLDVEGDGTPWITTTDNKIYRWNGSTFIQIPGTGIDVGIHGTHIFVVGADNEVYRWNGSSLQQESNLGIAWRIDARPNGGALVISLDSLNHWHQNTGFLEAAPKGQFKAIDASIPHGDFKYYCLSRDGVVHEYIGGGNYIPIGGSGGTSYSMGMNGEVWVTQANQMLHRRTCAQIQDTDSDGDRVCNDQDQCPNFDDSLIGQPCDDGDECTTGETYTTNCLCEGGVSQDTDNDGVCDTLDECDILSSDDFEQNSGFWLSGGNDANRVMSAFSPSGSFSYRIRDNSFESSSVNSPIMDMSTSAGTLNFKFDYQAVNMASNHVFFLEISIDGGNTFTIYEDWKSGVEFQNNIVYQESIEISSTTLSPTTVFRLRCHSSINANQVFIDNIELEFCEQECLDYAIQSDNNTVQNSQVVRIGIESNGIIQSGETIDFNAGSYILMEAGFEVKSQALFHAFIEGCE